MRRILLALLVVGLAGCQTAPNQQAMARMNMAENGGTVVPPAASRPIVEPEGNVVQCTVYPGPGAANTCIQK